MTSDDGDTKTLRKVKMHRQIMGALFLSLLSGCASNPANAINDGAPAGTGISVQSLKLADGSTKKCSVFVPHAYNAKTSWPTIVFLQGLGEGGSDGVKNTTVGLGQAIRKRASGFGYLVVFPQSSGPWSSDGARQLAMQTLDAVEAKYNVDRKRVYLTGLSTGGYGTWAIGAAHSDRFAALVPLCGYSGEAYAARLVGMPIWAFHNRGDPFVFASSTKDTVNKINKVGGRAKITVYSDIGHNCWDRAYADDALWAWLAEQHK